MLPNEDLQTEGYYRYSDKLTKEKLYQAKSRELSAANPRGFGQSQSSLVFKSCIDVGKNCIYSWFFEGWPLVWRHFLREVTC